MKLVDTLDGGMKTERAVAEFKYPAASANLPPASQRPERHALACFRDNRPVAPNVWCGLKSKSVVEQAKKHNEKTREIVASQVGFAAGIFRGVPTAKLVAAGPTSDAV